MELAEFSFRQEQFIRKAGRDLARLIGLRGLERAEETVERWRQNAIACGNPYVKGVSVNELLHEVMAPGSFSNGECAECDHLMRYHGPDGCEIERGDGYIGGNFQALGPCGCMG